MKEHKQRFQKAREAFHNFMSQIKESLANNAKGFNYYAYYELNAPYYLDLATKVLKRSYKSKKEITSAGESEYKDYCDSRYNIWNDNNGGVFGRVQIDDEKVYFKTVKVKDVKFLLIFSRITERGAVGDGACVRFKGNRAIGDVHFYNYPDPASRGNIDELLFEGDNRELLRTVESKMNNKNIAKWLRK